MPNNLVHVCSNSSALSCTGFEHIVRCSWKPTNFYSPPLGWFNDELCTFDYMNKCFTSICKLCCNDLIWFLSCDNSSPSYFTRHANYKSITLSYVEQIRQIKTDDIYIYHVYALSLLLVMFQKKHRRGRLYSQEREDDIDRKSVV